MDANLRYGMARWGSDVGEEGSWEGGKMGNRGNTGE